MAKPEWGTKRVCQNCGTIYYDMKKNPAVCPNCGTKFDPEALLKSRRGRALPDEAVEEVKVLKASPEDELEALGDTELDEELEAGDDEDEAVIEDVSELGEDDDMGVEVVEGDNEDDR